MTASERKAYVGVYAFGEGETDRLEVSEHSRTQMLRIKRSGQQFGRAMFYLGSHEFHPTGAPSVRIRFALAGHQLEGLRPDRAGRTQYDDALHGSRRSCSLVRPKRRSRCW